MSKQARIADDVIIGPNTIIEDGVSIGAGTIIGSHAVIHRGTVIGKNNHIHNGAQIGVEPQDYHYRGEKSQCIIGNSNTIREYATISRATGENCRTIIGDNNFIMTYVHVAHNDSIGSNVIIASGVQIGGYVEIGDHANIGGLSGIHQFCRVGTYSMLGAKSYLNQDLLPFLLARGNRARLYGVNVRGLARKGFKRAQIETIKDLYRPMLQSGISFTDWQTGLDRVEGCSEEKALIKDFAGRSQRGILLRTAKQ